jgi:hypothetical protein
MAFCEYHYFSPALGRQTAANVLLPEVGKAPYPVMYLLHGLSDDYTMWSRRSNIERHVGNVPLIVVMPDGGRGFYTDAAEGQQFLTAIAEELVDRIDRTFPTDAGSREPVRDWSFDGGLRRAQVRPCPPGPVLVGGQHVRRGWLGSQRTRQRR